MTTTNLLTAEALAEMQKRLDDPHNQGGMQSICGEYECDCHRELPALLAHVAAMQARLDDAYLANQHLLKQVDTVNEDAIEAFRQRAVAAVRMLSDNQLNRTMICATLQQLPATTTEGGE